MVNGYKVKRIMLGTKQVRPPVQEYYYDFVGKNYQTCVDDGWTFQGGNTHWEFTANGLHSTYIHSDHGYKFRSVVKSSNLTNVNKITFEATIYSNYGYLMGSLAIGFISALQDSSDKYAGYYSCMDGSDTGFGFVKLSTITKDSSSALTTGTYSVKVEIDLANGIMKNTVTGKTTVTTSISSTDITNIRSYPYRGIRWDANGGYIKTINAKFE